MDRCAVFVDAGYLHESAKTLLTAGHPGATVRANALRLVTEIASLAVAQTQMPLLRIYWYAAAPNRNPYPDQRELASLQDIKLRLGNLRERAGGRMVQKGVDAELHADMTGLARNRGAVDFVLLSGDEDLLRAVDEVQSFGVRVHLWGVEAGPDGGNQSLELIAAADRRHVLEEPWLSNVFTIMQPPRHDSLIALPPRPAGQALAQPPLSDPLLPGQLLPDRVSADQIAGTRQMLRPNGESASSDLALRELGEVFANPSATHSQPIPQSEISAVPVANSPTPETADNRPDAASADESQSEAPSNETGEAAATTNSDPNRPSIPKPTDLRPRSSTIGLRGPTSTIIYTAPPGQPGYSPRPDYAFYRLSDLTTQAEQYADAAEDEGVVYDSISVGKVYARRWLSRATMEAAALLAQGYPTIPRTIDAELLRYAVSRGVDTWTSETDKFAVRQGFWGEVKANLQAREPARVD